MSLSWQDQMASCLSRLLPFTSLLQLGLAHPNYLQILHFHLYLFFVEINQSLNLWCLIA